MATLMLSVGRADDARRRRAEPHPGRQQQHLLPGQRAHLAQLGPGRPAEVVPGIHPKADLHLAEPAGPPAAEVLPGPGHPRLGDQGHLVLQSGGPGDVGRGLECRLRQVPGRAAGRRPDQRRERAGRADRGRDVAAPAQRPLGADLVHPAHDQRRPHLGPDPGHGRPERATAGLRGRPAVRDQGPFAWRSWPPARPRTGACP